MFHILLIFLKRQWHETFNPIKKKFTIDLHGCKIMIRVAGPELTCTSGGGGPWNHSDEQQCFGRPVLNSSKYSLFNLCETNPFFLNIYSN